MKERPPFRLFPNPTALVSGHFAECYATGLYLSYNHIKIEYFGQPSILSIKLLKPIFTTEYLERLAPVYCVSGFPLRQETISKMQ